ncbi:hypothetical protein MMC28_001044 [Mycoblastus sanguinarius]|nr:hypothetical protein [Mycoblastus sanguinarius]
METVSSATDLDYIDNKLNACIHPALRKSKPRTFSSPHEGGVATGSGRLVEPTACPTSQRCSVLEVGDPTISSVFGDEDDSDPSTFIDLRKVSPNSQIRCDSHTCPIKTPHNLGKYFHNGEAPVKEPAGWEYENSIGGKMAPVSHYFNFTVPPPNVWEAFTRISEGRANEAESELVREFQKHHMYSPLNSGPPTPKAGKPSRLARSKCNLPVVRAKILPVESSKVDNRTRGFVDEASEPGFQEKKAPRKLRSKQTVVFHDQNNLPSRKTQDRRNAIIPAAADGCKNDQSFQKVHNKRTAPPIPPRNPIRLSRREKRARPLRPSDFENSDGEDENAKNRRTGAPKGSVVLREVPQGDRLTTVQVLLQEKMLRQISHEALREASAEEDDKDSEKTFVGTEIPNSSDRYVEILLELMEILRSALNDGSYEVLNLRDEDGYSCYSANLKFAVLCDIEMMARHALRNAISNVKRVFRPTGKKVTFDELQDVFQHFVSTRPVLLNNHPGKSICEIVEETENMDLRPDSPTLGWSHIGR